MTEISVSTLYSVLALPTNATADDVLQTYHATVRQYHPDHLERRDARSLTNAKSQFIALTRARDVLADPASRRSYDAQRSVSGQPTMYGFSYGYVDHKSDVLWETSLSAVDYDMAWKMFISRPFDWSKTGSPVLNRWITASWLGLLVCVVGAGGIYALLGFSGPLVFAYLATTHSSPMIMSFSPLIAGFVGAGLGIVMTVTVITCLIIKYPYSAAHSLAFWGYVVGDVLLSFLLTWTLSLAFIGMIVGYYLF